MQTGFELFLWYYINPCKINCTYLLLVQCKIQKFQLLARLFLKR